MHNTCNYVRKVEVISYQISFLIVRTILILVQSRDELASSSLPVMGQQNICSSFFNEFDNLIIMHLYLSTKFYTHCVI